MSKLNPRFDKLEIVLLSAGIICAGIIFGSAIVEVFSKGAFNPLWIVIISMGIGLCLSGWLGKHRANRLSMSQKQNQQQ